MPWDMTTYYYDSATNTVRRYGHLTAGAHIGERFDKEAREWVSECCRRSGCKWDKEISQSEAESITNQRS